ncbi:hypothetical protein KY363_07750 [Candidatus Woesearchaeota archaeon]|nr:hypothetical protein [Candidatus Woesearchaeota archaeon]
MAKLILELAGRDEPMYLEREMTPDMEGGLGGAIYALMAERPKNAQELEAMAQLYAFETGAVPVSKRLQNHEDLVRYAPNTAELLLGWEGIPVQQVVKDGLDVRVSMSVLHIDGGFAGSEEYVRNRVELFEFTCQEKLDGVKRYTEWQKGRMGE